MKIVKISSLGCVSCIIMNKVINKLNEKYELEIEEIDYDFDETDKYNPGNIMPVIIFYKDDVEYKRLCGEHKLEELESIIEEIK